MSQTIGMISVTKPSFQNSFSTKNQNLKPLQGLNLNTPLSKSAISSKTPSRSSRFSTKASIKDMYVTSSEPKQSFYELLGVAETGTLFEIKQAYKKMARKYHPDVSPPDRTEEYTTTFIQVKEAYDTLSDPKSRALYDSDLSRGLHMAFSPSKWRTNNQEMDVRQNWRNLWLNQLAQLRRRSNSMSNNTWGAKMRRRRAESSDDFQAEFCYC